MRFEVGDCHELCEQVDNIPHPPNEEERIVMFTAPQACVAS